MFLAAIKRADQKKLRHPTGKRPPGLVRAIWRQTFRPWHQWTKKAGKVAAFLVI